ncbi:MAG: CDP-glycerol glycerophosphotransferase family protein [Eubacterium sp.]|nr:CDP-glycerol glycerophosphotransferase family protein [Eubacterium sp.]
MCALISKKNKRFLKKRAKFWKECITHPILNEHLVVFEAFSGKRCGGNLRAIYEYMMTAEEYKEFRYVWIVTDVEAHRDLKVRRNTRVVKKDSRAAYILYAKAKYWFNNVALPNYLIPRPRQVYVETWHGTPLKKLGNDIEYEVDPRQTLAEMHKKYYVKGRKMDYLVSPSRFYSEKMISCFRLDKSGKEDIIIETGYPRNDALFKFTDEDVARIKEEIGIPEGKKLILYTPTWRDNQFKKGDGFQYNTELDFGKLMKELGDDYILLFRAHHQIGFKDVASDVTNVIDVTQVDDVNDLYIISDMMITDYSSTMFDYGNLKRPMVFYMYDLNEYQGEVRDFYFDIDELPGPIVKTQKDLLDAIRDQFENFKYDDKYKAFTEKFNYLDDANAAKRVVEKTISLDFGPFYRMYKGTIHCKNVLRKAARDNYIKLSGLFRRMGLCVTDNSKLLRSYKNKHKGERCFLIGNGPSLKISDLEGLQEKGEITFGCNLVTKVFDQTKWRPDYYFMIDRICAKYRSEEIDEAIGDIPLFTNITTYNIFRQKPKNPVILYNIAKAKYRVHSSPLAYYIPSGSTVMSLMIEMAVYMGFKEIYLVGCDCTSTFSGNTHFIKDYTDDNLKEKDAKKIIARMRKLGIEGDDYEKYFLDGSLNAYTLLKEHAMKRGVNIYNATRGGALEVYERRNLDDFI